MECDTIQKMSFQPVCATAPQRPPWACKGQYQKPCQKVQHRYFLFCFSTYAHPGARQWEPIVETFDSPRP